MIRNILFTLLFVVSLLCACLMAQDQTAASVPKLMRFSGTVEDTSGQPVTGMVGLTFGLYKQQEGGEAIWLETQNVELDTSGRYIVLLGQSKLEGLPVELFSSGEARWLEVQATGMAPQPRILLVSVPYALKAADAETLGGKPASAFLTVESPPAAAIGAGSVSSPTTVGSNQGGSRTAATSLASGAPCAGAGAAPRVTKFVGSSVNCMLGPSNIFNPPGFVGIQEPNPKHTLDVKGDFNLPATSSSNVGVIKLGGMPFLHAFGPGACCNTFLGFNAGNFKNTGFQNTAVGVQALAAIIDGYQNTAIGVQALAANTSGVDNTASGYWTLLSNTTGTANVASGDLALASNTTGSINTASGEEAMVNNETGTGNTASGQLALSNNFAGSYNTAIGTLAGGSSQGSNNTFIGAIADVGPGNQHFTNATAIGYFATVGASNSLVLGGTGTNAVNVGIGLTKPIATLDIQSATSVHHANLFLAHSVLGGCSVDSDGNLVCTGSKSAAVSVDNGQRQVALYAMEAPENWFEDLRSSQLVRGEAIVELDPAFVQTVNTSGYYHVFLTPEGECEGLYVTQKTSTIFQVRELHGGHSNVAFDYRVVALRRGYEGVRLADMTPTVANIKARLPETRSMPRPQLKRPFLMPPRR